MADNAPVPPDSAVINELGVSPLFLRRRRAATIAQGVVLLAALLGGLVWLRARYYWDDLTPIFAFMLPAALLVGALVYDYNRRTAWSCIRADASGVIVQWMQTYVLDACPYAGQTLRLRRTPRRWVLTIDGPIPDRLFYPRRLRIPIAAFPGLADFLDRHGGEACAVKQGGR